MTSLSRMPRVLAIDDDTLWLEQVPEILSGIADVATSPNIDDALNLLREQCFDVVLLDLNFDGDPDHRNGLHIFKQIAAMNFGVDVIVISGESNTQNLIEVFNAGVTRFIPKPAQITQIRYEVQKVLELRSARAEAVASMAGNGDVMNPLIGNSPAITRLRLQVQDLLRVGFKDLLLEGETGTGKEVMARYLALQLAHGARFLPIHCGAINDGLAESELFGHLKGAFTGADKDRVGVFEAAAGGIVFLDEIGEMPLNQQAKLLRVIQERKIQRVGSFEERLASFRTISATNVDLKLAVHDGRFREDLYFRVSKEKLSLPPLRERNEDIPHLIESFGLRNLAGEKVEFSSSAMDMLLDYRWPGNLRQLRVIVEALAARSSGSVVREKELCALLPEAMPGASSGLGKGTILFSYSNAVTVAERKRFERALVHARGNRIDAAKILGLSRATFFRRAKELGLVGIRIPNSSKLRADWERGSRE